MYSIEQLADMTLEKRDTIYPAADRRMKGGITRSSGQDL
jgi:hypothetical protein